MSENNLPGDRPRSHTVWDIGVDETPRGGDFVPMPLGETRPRGRRAAVVDDETIAAAAAAAARMPVLEDTGEVPVLLEEPLEQPAAPVDLGVPFAAPAAVVPPVVAPAAPSAPFAVGRDPEAALRAALQAVVDRGASDLHLGAGAPPKVRVDGSLASIPDAPIWSGAEVGAILRAVMSETQRLRFAQELELDFAYSLSDEYRFRVNVYQQRESMGAAFRLIPTNIKSLEELGIPDSVARFAQLPRGLVLVTGPTGSGKSTTLAALIDLANRTRSDHIMTVEDPIEFLHSNKRSLVNQREVGADTHSFAAALKHVLRQDPDIILIGELRDLETISVALTAAETGHLVFATLHTQDAAQTVDRIIDVFAPAQQGQVRAQLAGTLQGVVSQTLVRKASGSGRAVATEVLVTTPAVANLIREGKTFQISSAMQAGRDLGMHTMDQHLADLVAQGTITRQAAAEKAHDLEGLGRLLGRAGAGMGDLDLAYAEAATAGQGVLS
ncbi:type IV pilus twitching motility protein PilT [Naasia aerilata]|nr:type IV pilus twitching motility protein PilT [Naasia aerilata]